MPGNGTPPVARAARELGISYPTLKPWIYRHKIRSVRTPGGHYRIPRIEIDRLTFFGETRSNSRAGTSQALQTSKGFEHFISGRNQLIGRVRNVEIEGLLAKVVLDQGGRRSPPSSPATPVAISA
jgi:excisionase family DNA binding protein